MFIFFNTDGMVAELLASRSFIVVVAVGGGAAEKYGTGGQRKNEHSLVPKEDARYTRNPLRNNRSLLSMAITGSSRYLAHSSQNTTCMENTPPYFYFYPTCVLCGFLGQNVLQPVRGLHLLSKVIVVVVEHQTLQKYNQFIFSFFRLQESHT